MDETLVYDIKGDINLGDTAEDGAQLRPNIVWFEEPVPLIEEAARLVRQADLFAVIGTSLVVYPAAGPGKLCPLEYSQVYHRQKDTLYFLGG